MTRTQSNKVIRIAAAYRLVQQHNRNRKMQRFTPYPWQQKTFAAGSDNPQRLACCGNRTGKSYGGTYELALHLTGQYPDGWTGKRFDHATSCIASGVSGESMRDILQTDIFGQWEDDRKCFKPGGWIPPALVGDILKSSVTKDGVRDVTVKHVTGNWSTLSFRSYSQGHMVIAGTTRDFILIDEEPEHNSLEFYSQCVTRTMTGGKGKGGSVLLTFTPEHGLTPLVRQFMEDRKEGQWIIHAGWDDAPHLTEEVKEQMLGAIPVYQHKMRRYGLPVFSEGMVFPIAEEAITIDDFELPNYCRICFGFDFGFTHPSALVRVAYDPERDIIYITRCYKYEKQTPDFIAPQIISAGGAQLPVIYPHDGDNSEKSTGDTMAAQYQRLGVNMFIKFSNPENVDGHNRVEPGIQHMLSLMRTNKLKVFKSCSDWLGEFRAYHRKNGKIVKELDDVMDASRYAVLSVQRFGSTMHETQRRSDYSLAPELEF